MDYGSGASTVNGIFEWRDTVVKASYSTFMFSTEEFNLYPAGGSKRKCEGGGSLSLLSLSSLSRLSSSSHRSSCRSLRCGVAKKASLKTVHKGIPYHIKNCTSLFVGVEKTTQVVDRRGAQEIFKQGTRNTNNPPPYRAFGVPPKELT